MADGEHLVRVAGNDARSYNFRGLVRLQQGQHTSALEDFDRSITINPAVGFAYENRALAHKAMSNRDLALADLSRALSVNPKSARALTIRAQIYIADGELDRAIAEFKQALASTRTSSRRSWVSSRHWSPSRCRRSTSDLDHRLSEPCLQPARPPSTYGRRRVSEDRVMNASRLASCVAATSALGRAFSLLRRRAAALATACAIGLPCIAAPAHAATVTRVEIGSPNTTAFLLSGQFVGGELLALQAEVAKLPSDRRVAVILDSPGGLVSRGPEARPLLPRRQDRHVRVRGRDRLPQRLRAGVPRRTRRRHRQAAARDDVGRAAGLPPVRRQVRSRQDLQQEGHGHGRRGHASGHGQHHRLPARHRRRPGTSCR